MLAQYLASGVREGAMSLLENSGGLKTNDMNEEKCCQINKIYNKNIPFHVGLLRRCSPVLSSVLCPSICLCPVLCILTSKVFPQRSWQVRQWRQSQSRPVWPDPAQSAGCYQLSHLWMGRGGWREWECEENIYCGHSSQQKQFKGSIMHYAYVLCIYRCHTFILMGFMSFLNFCIGTWDETEQSKGFIWHHCWMPVIFACHKR